MTDPGIFHTTVPFLSKISSRFPRYRYIVPTAPRVSPCATDMPSLRDLTPVYNLLFKPRRGAISVDTQRPTIPSSKPHRGDITVTAGDNPAPHAPPHSLQSIISYRSPSSIAPRLVALSFERLVLLSSLFSLELLVGFVGFLFTGTCIARCSSSCRRSSASSRFFS